MVLRESLGLVEAKFGCGVGVWVPIQHSSAVESGSFNGSQDAAQDGLEPSTYMKGPGSGQHGVPEEVPGPFAGGGSGIRTRGGL